MAVEQWPKPAQWVALVVMLGLCALMVVALAALAWGVVVGLLSG